METKNIKSAVDETWGLYSFKCNFVTAFDNNSVSKPKDNAKYISPNLL